MTRRKSRANKRDADNSRHQRICKLIERGWIQTASEIPESALPVDPDRINLGGSYHRPIFFTDQPFVCQDCGTPCVWKAEDQRWYFETMQAPYYETPKRCRPCRRNERIRKNQARIQAGHATFNEQEVQASDGDKSSH